MSHNWIPVVTLLCVGCSDAIDKSNDSIVVPSEIIDLGALVTEQTPEEFWGKGFMNEMDFTESNKFDVLARTFGPLNVSNSYYTLFNHGGPHVDAPNHVGLGGGLDTYPVESFAGPLKVFDFSHLPIGRSITKEMLIDLPIDSGDIVLIYTEYSPPSAEGAWPEAIALNYDAANFLAALPVRAFGTDAYNVESMTDQSPVPSDNEVARIIPGHHAFLSKGIPVFEQLVNVDKLVGKEAMYFVGAPLNIKDGDGMMVRPLVLVY
ncbi:MAG: cyclase family protein [Woeseiaceae bacterium]|nr:cyclase family protein [Woeseiaceae bacterium]